ncbi:MAG: helix-turn-helix domain-containing protein [Burkholderiaceae bacterium]|jgi:Fis family transcriptional regulator
MNADSRKPDDAHTADLAVPKVGETVRKALDHYFKALGDQSPHALYDMVILAAEKPLLEVVMARYRGNISHAAKALGLTRNTLRKKLHFHGLATTDTP